MWRKILQLLRDVGLLLARLSVAYVLFMHGWHRWTGGVDKTIDWLRDNGVPIPGVLGWSLTALELAGAVFLAFGALTPIVGACMVTIAGLMIGWITWKNGFWAVNNGFEPQVLMIALGLVFLFFGAGRAAVDNLLTREQDDVAEAPDKVENFPSTPKRTPGAKITHS